MPVTFRRRTLGYASAMVLSSVAVISATRRTEAAPHFAPPDTTLSARTARLTSRNDLIHFVDDSLRGRSGKLFARFVLPGVNAPAGPELTELFGDSTLDEPGVYPLSGDSLAEPFAFVSLVPFSAKPGATLGAYHIGFWPGEHRAVSRDYANPVGFIEVTPANVDVRVSEHFRLRDFLTHDQTKVWPKYLVLRTDLVDKLELVIEDLQKNGVPVKHMTVMSGFRTPQYNATGGDPSGRVEMSRHMYGDASDVFVDNDFDGKMDDLNHDGRIDYRDAQVILAAEERVEAAHPELVGGGGVYKGTRAHGPFTHIDVRGTRSRWGLTE
ncbi:MAG TPA: hypothetical protein VGM67_17155 [Gemmatimonadaceae bacterium]|jgi:hypothetical protein